MGAIGRGLLVTAAFVIVVAGMRQAQEIVVPSLMAGFLAVLCLPPIAWTERRMGLPRGLAVGLVMAGVVVFGGALVSMIVGAMTVLAEELPAYRDQLAQRARDLADTVADLDLPLMPDKGNLSEWLTQAINTDAVLDYITRFAGQLGGLLTNTLLIVLLVIFILLEGISIRDKIGLGRDDPEGARQRFDQVLEEVNRYMGLKTLVSLFTGGFIAGTLAIIGLDHPMLWGVLAFLLNYIPNLGSIIAAVPAVMLALLQGGAVMAGQVMVLYVVVNMVVGNVVEPRVMGQGLGLSTLVVFLSLVFWGWLLGPVGMLLSVPLTMAVKIALEAHPDGRSLAIWLGPPAGGAAKKQTASAGGAAKS